LELLIIQPDISYTPDCSQNQELLEIYQKDLDLFARLIHEHIPNFNTPDFNFGKIFRVCLLILLGIALEEPFEDNSNLMVIEKQLSQMKMNENMGMNMNMMRSDNNIVKSLKYDFEKYEPKKFDLFSNENTNHNNNYVAPKKHSKKRRNRDEESLINPFLKKVRITPV